MLLATKQVKSRVHRLVFTAHDALGAIAGVDILLNKFGLVPHTISVLCSALPLAVKELNDFTDIPAVSNTRRDLNQWARIVL
jgi:hypothetical protein